MARKQPPVEPKNPPTSVNEAQIFVVDDKEVLVQFAEAVLQSAGYQVRSFTDPKETLKAILQADTKPILLITDYDMGEMNGVQLIQAVHTDCPGLKVILLSGTVTEDFIKASPVKVNRFMAKPYQPPKLISIVAEVLAK